MSSKTTSTLILIFVFTLLAVGMARRVKRVVGGNQYTKGKYPFHVSLWYMGDNNFYTANTPDLHHTCGGSLIAEEWVLTSAACFDDNFLPGVGDPKNWRAYVGMYSQRGAEAEATPIEIKEIFYSPNYNLTESYGDEALLKIGGDIDLEDPNIGLVDFNTDDDWPETGHICTVIGWGMLAEEPFGLGSDFPHEVQVPVADLDKCQETYSPDEIVALMGPIRIDEGMLCAGREEGGIDACSGDAGSPLVCYDTDDDGVGEPIVVATVTTGFGCARPNFPGVYTRTSANADWIIETMEDN